VVFPTPSMRIVVSIANGMLTMALAILTVLDVF
jgi:hypothetical protein